MSEEIIKAVQDTVIMVGFSTVFATILGFIPAIILTLTAKDGLRPNKAVYNTLDFVINILRSFPFIILMVVLFPISRLVVGTSIGVKAAIIPLTIGTAPFIARIIENALREVDKGIVEAAKSFGATDFQIIFKVLLKEAIPAIVSGLTLTTISVIGYSAMAGAIGAGGLGDVAIRYGYHRTNTKVLIITVILLIIIVQVVQSLGNLIYKKLNNGKSKGTISKKKAFIGIAVAVVALIVVGSAGVVVSNKNDKEIKIGVSPVPHKEIVEEAKADLEAKGYKVNIIEFNDYVTPNTALAEGSLDANFFQHIPYLNEQNKSRNLNLDYTAQVHLEPLGAYSKKIKDIKELKDGDIIAIPNDPSNEARALKLLAENGLIKVEDGELITPKDIIENPKNLKFKELEAATIPKVLEDVSLAVINGNYAIDAGYEIKDALIKENKDSEGAKPYGNIIAVRKDDKDSQKIKDLTRALTSDKVRDFINEKYNGNVIPVF